MAASSSKAPGRFPGVAEFFKGVIPPNVVAAASNGDILPLTVFSVLFALALTRIAGGRPAHRWSTFSKRSAMRLLVIIAWVLWIAPLGVFALAFTVGVGGRRRGLRRAWPLYRAHLGRSAFS